MLWQRLLRQLSPAYLVLTLAAVATTCWFAVRSFEVLIGAGTNERLEAAAQLVDREIGHREIGDGEIDDREVADLAESLQPVCRGLAGAGPMRVRVSDASGRLLFDSEADHDSARAPRGTAENLAPRAGLLVTHPLVRQGKQLGSIEVATPLTGSARLLSDFQGRIVLIGLCVVAAVLLLSPVAARRTRRPLEEMRQAAERFARGELGYQLVVPQREELAGLADALNQMAAQLQERISTIVRQNNEQRAVLASMAEGVLAVDNQQRIISLNKASGQLLGIDQVQAQGRGLQEVVRNADLRRFISRALTCNEPIDDDVVLHGDHEGVLQARGAALHDAHGRGIGAVVVLNDVTDFRRLEHIRRDFVANVSHELKTPITSIKGFVETLLDGAVNEKADAQRFLQIIAKQADRLDAIIEDLLSLSKIEQGEETGDIALETGCLSDVVAAAVHNCQLKAAERGISVCFACEDDVVAAINAPLLEQAVTNLLDNAVKYSEPASEVQLLATRFYDEVTITVSDRGCGIAAEHLSRVFERFYRVDKARSRKLGGTGLGLAIVKHIVQAHHGHVTVKSTPGMGSVFTIHLPRAADDTSAEISPHAA